MKAIEKLFSSYTVTNEMKYKVPEKDLEAIVKRELAWGVSKFIFENLSELPVKQVVLDGINNTQQEHRISFYMISEEELKRLKEIERLHMPLSFEPI